MDDQIRSSVLDSDLVNVGIIVQQVVPDWVRGELASEISSATSLGMNPAASSTLRHDFGAVGGSPTRR